MENPAKPKITVEEESSLTGILLVGEESPLTAILREILISKGVKVDDPSGFNYIFQLGNLGKTEDFLKKAVDRGAKFFLILGENSNSKLSQKAEKLIQKYRVDHRLQAKIIKLSGFAGQEIEVAEKILKIVFGQNVEDVITLKGPGALWTESKSQVRPVAKKNHTLWKALAFIFFFLLAPIIFILANIFLGAWALNGTREALLASDFTRARQEALSSQKLFASAENGFNALLPMVSLLGQNERAQGIGKWLEVGQNLGLASGHLAAVGQEGQKLASIILGKGQGSPEDVLSQLTDNVNLAQRELSLTEAKIPGQPPFLENNLTQIKTLRKAMGRLQGFLQVFPWVLGIGSKRTYLVLLQNNMELRPGGGFIGTIGLLTFTDGQMDFKIEDVYTADGQLRGHVEPPAPLRNYLNQIHWYLRDSNWDPDFSVNAERAAWFYEKEMGVRPDGVFALDLSLAQNILSLTGPIELSDYQEKISADNFFLKAQIYTQEKFFPGSTQKRDFLSSLATALFNKLTAGSDFPWFGLGRVVEKATQEKHFLVYFANELAQRLVSEQGLSGEILTAPCPEGTGCVNDYLMVVEANLGVNKVNYFLKRDIEKWVNFTPDGLNSKVLITYKNTSPTGVTFGGHYQNYLRVLRPLGFSLEKVTLDGQNLSLDKIDQEIMAGKNSAGFLVSVPPGAKKTVEFSYKLSLDPSEKDFTYQLLAQKQTGTDKDMFILNLATPAWQILGTNFPATAQNGNVSYKTDLTVDRIFTVRLKRLN